MQAKQYEKTLEILLNLINRFYLGEKITTLMIENQYEVSRRTAQRYIKYLKSAGFNLVKDGTSYHLETQIGDKETLFEAIITIAKNAGIDKDLSPLLEQLKLVSEENVFYSKIDMEKIENIKLFRDIELAIKKHQKIKIVYNTKEVVVKPLKISNFEGYWYLNCLNEKSQYRVYHLKSIKKLELLNETFKVEEDILKNLENAINIWFNPIKKSYLVELFADKDATKYLKRIPLSKTQTMIENDDKTSIIYLQITDDREVERKIKSWLPHIKVIKPLSLKNKIEKELKEYLG